MIYSNKILSDKLFWIIYFRLFLKKVEYDSFWNDPKFDQLLEKIYPPSSKKTKIVIKYPHDYEVRIVFSTSPETGNVDAYYLCHPTFPEPLFLGEDSPHFILPIFRWEEINWLITQGEVDFDRKYLPLLFLKTAYVTRDDDFTAISGKFLPFLEKTNLFPGEETDIMKLILNLHKGVAWEKDDQYGWVHTSDLSRRKKTTLNEKISTFFDSTRL